jgi:hypothetical protein
MVINVVIVITVVVVIRQTKKNCWLPITWQKKIIIESIGRNELLFHFEILFFDTVNLDTTADPLAVTMLVSSTGTCISWKISVTVMILW